MFQISSNYQKNYSNSLLLLDRVQFSNQIENFQRVYLLILNKSNLNKILFLIAPSFVLEA